MEYKQVFDKRAESYLRALTKYPRVLDNEFANALAVCKLKSGDVFVTIPSSCENIGVPDNVSHIRFETSDILATLTSIDYCKFDAIPLADQSVDVVLSLASLHHSTEAERLAFYKETFRILKKQGRLIVGDVRKDSKQDTWLNTFVHANNSYGHTGKFFRDDDALLLQTAGFDTTVLQKQYTWDFENKNAQIDFCKDLFHLDRATKETIEEGLRDILNARSNGFDWELLYFVGSKP